MSTTKAPPLGSLTRGESSSDIPLSNVTTTTGKLPPLPPLASAVSANPPSELNFSAPTNASSIPTPNVESVVQQVPQLPAVTANGQPQGTQNALGVNWQQLSQLAGNESTPFTYTGYGAGKGETAPLVVDPSIGAAVHQSQQGEYVQDTTQFQGSSNVVIANGRAVHQYDYTAGLTQSQQNQRNFFGSLQGLRQDIAPHMLPALQYTPQQLSPGVAGGFAPTAESKGPLSWLLGEPTSDVNPLKMEYGASGSGILGAVGWVFGRLSPATYVQGAAMDISRSAAALIEGGSAGVSQLLKGDVSGAFNAATDAASSNYYANAPVQRGMPGRTVMGNSDLGDFLSSSYTGSALAGFNDLSFSGTGNRGASRDVVNQGDSFNPFGFRDPFRSGFNTGRLEAQERQQGAWFGHGYDQWGGAAGGLVADVVFQGRVDKVVEKAFKSGAKATVQQEIRAVQRGQLVNPQATQFPGAKITELPLLPGTGAIVKSGGSGVELHASRVQPFNTKDFLPLPGSTKNQGWVAPISPGADIPTRTPKEFNSASEQIRNLREAQSKSTPITQRYLPQGVDPLALQNNRAYRPVTGLAGADFEAGGAIIPYIGPKSTAAKEVPTILGIGGAPGAVPLVDTITGSSVLKGTNVTVYDEANKVFVKPTRTPVVRPLNSTESLYAKLRESGSPSRMTSEVPVPSSKVFVPDELPPGVNKLLSALSGDSTLTIPTVKPYDVPSTAPLPAVVPKSTPNYTVTPSPITDPVIRITHSVDDSTGIFMSTVEQTAITVRKSTLQVPEVPVKVTIPAQTVEYITAETLSPSVSSADIIRRLTSTTEAIPGAVYNPRHVERQQRTIASLVSLARGVTLPGGVRILDDTIKDASVMKFARLQNKVEQAIVASGLNPSSSEASALRRLFDKNGKPLPTNLSPDFAIQVADRTLDSPSMFVKPAKQVEAAVTDGEWTGKAARYRPTYELSGDYAVGVSVKYDEGLGRIVPIDGKDTKFIPAVKTEQPGGSIGRSQIMDMPVADRRVIVGKSLSDGFVVSPKAIEDAVNPNVLTDSVAAMDYAKANLPKQSVPQVMDREARDIIALHKDAVDELKYTGDALLDVSTQLTDVERNLNIYLKHIDETVPDHGIRPLTDDVPHSPLPELGATDLPPVVGLNKSEPGSLYHGTRIQDLTLHTSDPLKGATRSEYGTGIWLTSSQDIALSASGRRVPGNVVPNVKRTFSDGSYIHELPPGVLDTMNIPKATDKLPPKTSADLLSQLENNRFVFSDVIPYGDDLADELVNALETGKFKTYADYFSKADDIVRKVAKRNIGTNPDEYELTYIQRVMSDMLKGSGVQGLTNGVNTVVYDTRNLVTKAVHDVGDLVGDHTNPVVTALHDVNLLEQSLKYAPDSELLKVQLAEAKAVAASAVRDSLHDEMIALQKTQGKQVSDLMDLESSTVKNLADKQRATALVKAQTRDDVTYDSFSKELNKDWKGPCL
jgi:hypothetical protein